MPISIQLRLYEPGGVNVRCSRPDRRAATAITSHTAWRVGWDATVSGRVQNISTCNMRHDAPSCCSHLESAAAGGHHGCDDAWSIGCRLNHSPSIHASNALPDCQTSPLFVLQNTPALPTLSLPPCPLSFAPMVSLHCLHREADRCRGILSLELEHVCTVQMLMDFLPVYENARNGGRLQCSCT